MFGKRLLAQLFQPGGGQSLGLGGGIKRLARFDFGDHRLGVGFARHDQLRHAARFKCRVFRLVGIVARRNLGIGWRGRVLQHFLAKAGIADHAAFGANEIVLMRLVITGQFLVGRRLFRGEQRGRQQGDGAAALFLEQRGITSGQFLRHHRSERGRHHYLPGHQPLFQILAHQFFTDSALLQRLAERILAEAAIRPPESGNLGDFAIDQPVAGNDPVILAEHGDRRAVDHLVQHLVEPAVGQEAAHRHARIIPLHVFQRRAGSLAEIRGVDALVADHRRPVAPGHAAEAAIAGNVAAGKGEGDQHQHHYGGQRAEFGLEGSAEELEHRSAVFLKIVRKCVPASLRGL